MYTSYLPLNLTQLEENPNLHKKRISGSIETNAINLPYFIAFAKSEILSNIVIKGSATFLTEPIIQNINNIMLEKLFTRIWMITNFTVFYGKNLHIINALMKGNITLNVRKFRYFINFLLEFAAYYIITIYFRIL